MKAPLVVRLALRNVTRNVRRSFLTGLSVLLCVSLLILGISWLNGVLGTIVSDFIALTGPIRVLHKEFAQRERLLPIHENVTGVSELRKALAPAAPGGVYPRITFGAMLLKGEDQNAPGIGRGILVEDGVKNLKIEEHLVAGRMMTSGHDEVVVGKLVADELHLEPGDEVTLLGKGATDSIAAANLEVAGIFDAKSGMLNRAFYLDLAVAQNILDMDDAATELALFGRPLLMRRAIPPAVTAALASRPELVAQHWLVSGGFGSAFTIIRYVIGTIALIVMFVSGLGVLNTMMMAVMERRKELGVLLAQGAPIGFVVGMIVLEALVLGVVGATGGAVLGSAAAYLLELKGVTLGDATTRSLPVPVKDVIHADVNVYIVTAGFVMGLFVSAAGALIPAVRAVRIEPAKTLRID